MLVSYKLAPEALAPTRATPSAAGWDLYVNSVTHTLQYIQYGTGLYLAVPPGWCAKLYPRSSVSNTGQWLANSVGVVDCDYRGEIQVRFYTCGLDAREYLRGERCAQLMFERVASVEWLQADELPPSERGAGGFGSSGR